MTNLKPAADQFLRNYWYVGAWSYEVNNTPLARTLLNQQLVFFRTSGGEAVVLEDRCPHRFAPLSLGRVDGNVLECGYHGFAFGADGNCLRIPAMDKVPDAIRVRRYPTIELNGWLYVWMGDADLADESKLPPYYQMGEDKWVGSGETLHMAADYRLIRDNLLDLSHAKYVHRQTLATNEVDETPITTTTEEDIVGVLRRMENIEPSPFWSKAGDLKDRIIHRQLTEYHPSCNIVIRLRGMTIPKIALEKVIGFRVLNALVPETDTTTHYFWWLGRDFDLENSKLTEFMHKANADTFLEDKRVIEAQQREIDRVADTRPIVVPADAGVEAARKLDARLLAAESALRVAAE